MSGGKKRLTINAFKTRVKMDRDFADKTWGRLKEAIHKIYAKQNSQLSFEELYRNGYNLVVHKFGDHLYSGLQEVVDMHLQEVAARIEACNDEMFLPELILQWEQHKTSQLMIRDILMYMDRVYVSQTNSPTVYDMGLRFFLRNVARHPEIQDRLLKHLLNLIHRERSGEVVDRSQIRAVTSMLCELGTDRQVYEQDFEAAFLATSTDFYRLESQDIIANNSCPEYLKKAAARFEEEGNRVRHYLDAKTETKIGDVLDVELIQNHMKTLVEMDNSGLGPMLADDKFDDLARMYKLFARVKDGAGLTLIRTMMSDTVRAIGKQAVDDPENANPVPFIQAILTIKNKYDTIVQRAFKADKSFQNALNTSFEHFINLNNKSPEYLSLFLDDMLKRGLKSHTEEEVEGVLDKAMMLFRFLQDKDVFERYYKQHLAKRLLYNRSVSDDAERSMIAKLKTECGYQFTSKLEGMFNDIKLSADTMESFRAHLDNAAITTSGIDLSVQVLTTGYWPSQAPTTCVIPDSLQRCCDVFKDFYLAKHNGRRIAWQFTKGSADLIARFGDSLQRKHELSVSTHQMIVLLLYNQADKYTYKELAEATQIPPNELKRNLQSLSLTKTKVLLKKPATKEVKDDDVFSYNVGFSSRLTKVKVSTVSAQKETDVERQETKQKVDEDRKHQIEAAIVRILKARRRMEHNNLIAETIAQLSSRFMPNPAVIKKRIESLIEREYLERSEEDIKVYNYVA